jgi:Autotransporter beta-domain
MGGFITLNGGSDDMNKSEFSKVAKHGAIALLLGSVCAPVFMAAQAKADSNTDRIIQNVIQNILQDVRDQIQSRRLLPPSRMLRFSGEDANSASNSDDPFAALAYAKAPYTKAPPPPPPPAYLFGVNLVGEGDSSRAAGVTTSSISATGAVDITKIGITSATDALTLVFTGSGVWSHSFGLDTTTGVGAGTIAYINGGFSTDFTVDGTWTRTRLAAAGIAATPDVSGVSYAPNVQYKFYLPNTWYIEPTVGLTYTQTFTANFGVQTGDSTEVHAGARFGFESMWNTVRVQPSLTLAAFSIVGQSGTGGGVGPTGLPIAGGAGATPTGQVGGRASGKLNFLWTDKFSSFVEAHASTISNTDAYGASGGLRWTF